MTIILSTLSLTLWAIGIVGFVLPLIFGRKMRAGMHHRGDDEGALSD